MTNEEAIARIKDHMVIHKKNEPRAVLISEALEMAIAALKAQPEIVRCKDCKHRDAEDAFCQGRGWPMQLVPDDGFCDKGERRGR